jgi:hypothetical protein
MNAADVLADRFQTERGHPLGYQTHIDALLAHGEQGVAILPDGTLWALERQVNGYGHWTENHRLVPLSAEAGDTDGWPRCPMCGTEPANWQKVRVEIAGLSVALVECAECGQHDVTPELTAVSAEAGDTDG